MVTELGAAMSLEITITERMAEIAREQGKVLARLDSDLLLTDCGLDSLGFAILVARLEDELGVDPFTAGEDPFFPVTFGDFVKLYENCPH
jgi:Phosphopantetheine attachment site